MVKPISAKRHVLLIRGINVGGHHKVPMAELRELLGDLGHTNVRTLLNSGNAVFDVGRRAEPLKLAAAIEGALERRFGFRPRAFVLSADALDVVVAENALVSVGHNPSRLMVAFFSEASDRAKVAPLLRQDWGREALAVGSKAVYAWCPDGVLQSPLFEAVGRALRAGVTTRNWSTTLKVQAACLER